MAFSRLDRAWLSEMQKKTALDRDEVIRVALWRFAEFLGLNPPIDAFAIYHRPTARRYRTRDTKPPKNTTTTTYQLEDTYQQLLEESPDGRQTAERREDDR
jgi:hypothetical protein